MPRPLTPNQAAVSEYVAKRFAETREPVPFTELRAVSGVPSRFLTSTVASLIERDVLFVPAQGVAAYLPTSERLSRLAELLKIDGSGKDRDALAKQVKARLYGMGVRDACGRCGGSGHYSFNMIDGTKCWGCNGQQYVAVPLHTGKTWERAQAAVQAGQLDTYLAAREAKAAAQREIKPLRAEIETVAKSVHAACARSGFGGHTAPDVGVSVRSHSHRIKARANDASMRAFEVKLAIEGGRLDPEVGVLWAVAILTDARDELRELLRVAETATVEYLREQVHPDFPCAFCGTVLSVYADMRSGAKVRCFYPWVKDDAPGKGCGYVNTLP